MGIISDFMNSIDDMYIATEADDITGDVTSQTDDVMGNEGDDAENTGEIDTNTDDILGTQSDDSGDEDEGDDGEDTNPDDEPDDSEGDDSDISDDDVDDGMDDTDAPTEEDNKEDDPFMESRKRKIKKQFMHLYDVINDSVKLISTYNPNVNDNDCIHTLSSIKDNLLQCKDIIYNLATKDFQTAEYPELLKKYVAINRIYEISTKSLETFFEKYHQEQKKT